MNKKNTISLPIALAMILLIVALLYGLFIRPNFYRLKGGAIDFEVLEVGRLKTGTQEQVLTMGEHLYIASKEGVTQYDLKGNSIWNKSYHMEDVLFLAEGPYVAVVNLSGKEAFILDKEGVRGTITTEYQIITADLNNRGFLTLVQEDGQENYIMMYDNSGAVIMERKTLFKEDGYPIAIAMSPDSTKMATAHLDVSRHRVESVITFLDFSSMGETYEDRVVGHERLSDIMAAKLVYLNNTHMATVGDGAINFYTIEPTPKLVNRVAVTAEITHVTKAGPNLVVSYGAAMTPEGDAIAHSVVVYSDMGVPVDQEAMEKPVTGLYGDEEAYYIIQSTDITAHTNAGKLWATTVYKPVNAIHHINSDRYLLVFNNDYEVVTIRDI